MSKAVEDTNCVSMKKLLRRVFYLEDTEAKLMSKLDLLHGVGCPGESKELSRSLMDVRIRIKCLKKNNLFMKDKNGNDLVSTPHQFDFLTYENSIQNPKLDDHECNEDNINNNVFTNNISIYDEIDDDDDLFQPEKVKKKEVLSVESRINASLPLPHSKSRHVGSFYVPIRDQRELVGVLGEERLEQFGDAVEEECEKSVKDYEKTEEDYCEKDHEYKSQHVSDNVSKQKFKFVRKDQSLVHEKLNCMEDKVDLIKEIGVCRSSAGRACALKENLKNLPIKTSNIQVPSSSAISPGKCSVCHRRPTKITCSSCSFSFFGRLIIWCPLHPNESYLMDHLNICPRCNSVSLTENSSCGESEIPVKNVRFTDLTIRQSIRKESQINSRHLLGSLYHNVSTSKSNPSRHEGVKKRLIRLKESEESDR